MFVCVTVMMSQVSAMAMKAPAKGKKAAAIVAVTPAHRPRARGARTREVPPWFARIFAPRTPLPAGPRSGPQHGQQPAGRTVVRVGRG